MKTKAKKGLILLGAITSIIGLPILCKKAYRRGRKYLIDKTWEKMNDEDITPDIYNEYINKKAKSAMEGGRKVNYIPVKTKEDLEKLQSYEVIAVANTLCEILISKEEANKK